MTIKSLNVDRVSDRLINLVIMYITSTNAYYITKINQQSQIRMCSNN